MRLPDICDLYAHNLPIQTALVQCKTVYRASRIEYPVSRYVQKLSIKSDHSAGENRENLKKFYLHLLHRVTKIGHRESSAFFASKVTTRVIIEGRVFLQPSAEKMLMRKCVDE